MIVPRSRKGVRAMAVLESTDTRHVEDLMTREVITCLPDATLSDAAREMWEKDIGFLVVEHRWLD